jgi:carbon storage regulator CsrA
MLILTRRQGESLVVSIDGIKIAEIKYFKSNHNGKAEFGITAPAHVRVDRLEIYERIAAEQHNMSQATAESDSEPPERE